MNRILIVFFVALLLILLLILPFKIRIMGHFNLVEMKGFYCIKVLIFKILNGRMSMKNGEIIAENSINFMDNKMSKDYMKSLTGNILSRIDVKKVELYFTGGTSDSSFSSAIVCGSVSSLVQTIYSLLSQKYDNVKLFSEIEPTFNENNFELTFDMVVCVSLLSIFISVISAFFKVKKKKESQNER